MFSYTVAKTFDSKAFALVCSLIESKFREYEKEKLIEDVDGTVIQIYKIKGKEIKVVNDFEVGAVYIDSEVDLSSFI